MANKQQTAVEWLVEEISFLKDMNFDFGDGLPKDIIDKAKEMEREQIMQGYMEGLYYDKNSLYTPSKEQYYTETYKSE